MAKDPVLEKIKETFPQVQQQFNNFPRSPKFLLPEPLNPNQTELVLMGAVSDIAQYGLGWIPVVGDYLADVVSDNIEANMNRRLSQKEREEYREQNRFLPNSLSMYRTFTKERAGKL